MTQGLEIPFAMSIGGHPVNLAHLAEVPLAHPYASRGWKKFSAWQGGGVTLLGWTLNGWLVWMQVHNLAPLGPAIVVQTPDESAVVDGFSGWAWYDRTWLAHQVTAITTPADYNLQFSDKADAEDVQTPAHTGSAGIDFEAWAMCFAQRDGWSQPALWFAAEWLAIQIKRPGSSAMTPHGAPLSWVPGALPLFWGTHQKNAGGFSRKDEHHFDVQESAILASAPLYWPMAADSLVVDVALGAASFPSWRPDPKNTYYGNPRVAAHALRALARADYVLRHSSIGPPTSPAFPMLEAHLERVFELVMGDAWLQPWWTGGGHSEMHDAQQDFWTPWQKALLAWVLQELSEQTSLPDDVRSLAGGLAPVLCMKLADEAWDPETGEVWDDISADGKVKVKSGGLRFWLLPAMRRWDPQHPLVHLLLSQMDPKQFDATRYDWRYGARMLGLDVELGQAELLAQSAAEFSP